VLENEIAEPPQNALALGGLHRRPGTAVERRARRAHRAIHVLGAGFGDRAHRFLGGGVHGGEGLARCGVHGFAADDEPRGFHRRESLRHGRRPPERGGLWAGRAEVRRDPGTASIYVSITAVS
jgi:hypothetical protein